MKQLTKEQIILETLDYYIEDPNGRRGLLFNENGSLKGCSYITNDNKTCAVGRCMIEEVKKVYKENRSAEPSFVDGINNLDELLIKKYKGHSKYFWKDLQNLHDNSYNWDSKNNTISERGEEKVLELLERYKDEN